MARIVWRLRIGLLLAGGMALTAVPLRAATTVTVKVDGLTCSSINQYARGGFDITSFSFGGTHAADVVTAGGSSAAPADFGDVVVLKVFDQCTPKLFELLARGNHIPVVTIQWDKTGATHLTFMVIKLEEVLVSGLNYSASLESVSFSWAKMTITYTPERTDGSPGPPVSFSWDRVRNMAGA